MAVEPSSDVWSEIEMLRTELTQLRRDLDAGLVRIQLVCGIAMFVIGTLTPIVVLISDRFTA